MRSRIDVGDNGSKGSLVVEVPRGTSTTTRPDPEVPARAKRRRFTARYKLRILEEAEACRAPGEVGALLRREGLYSSQIHPREYTDVNCCLSDYCYKLQKWQRRLE